MAPSSPGVEGAPPCDELEPSPPTAACAAPVKPEVRPEPGHEAAWQGGAMSDVGSVHCQDSGVTAA
jgi:hypothetical protein